MGRPARSDYCCAGPLPSALRSVSVCLVATANASPTKRPATFSNRMVVAAAAIARVDRARAGPVQGRRREAEK